MPDQNIATAAAAPAPPAGPATTAPAAAGPSLPASQGPGESQPISTAVLSAALRRQFAGEPYTLQKPAAAAPGTEPSPETDPTGHSATSTSTSETSDPSGETAADSTQTQTEAQTAGDPEPEADPTGGNPAWAAMRVEAKKAKAEVKRLSEELKALKGQLETRETDAAATPAEPAGTLAGPATPELVKAEKDATEQGAIVQWARSAVTRLERGLRTDAADSVLTAIRAELGDQGAALPADPNAALDWLDNVHSGAADRLQEVRVQKQVLQRELQREAVALREDAREFAETHMPAVFTKGTPENQLMAQATQLFPGIDKNPWFHVWVVKAITGHKVLEAEQAKANGGAGNGRPVKPPARTIQVPGTKPTARIPGNTTHLPARPAEGSVQGSSYWMGQMRAATTAAARDAAKAEWQKALAQETGGGQPQAA